MIKTIDIVSNEPDFFDGMDTNGIDTDKTIGKYHEIVEEQIQSRFPDADINFVDSGTVSTYVLINDDWRVGDPETDETREMANAAQTVEHILSGVFEDGKFYVEVE